MGTKITVVIPTTGEREYFVTQALRLIKAQTMQPDEVIIVRRDQGITANYKQGFNQCGSGLMICWEDDDWYHPEYIATMYKMWDTHHRPTLFGWNRTVYYNIVSNWYSTFPHPNRASTMGTMINVDILKGVIDWSKMHPVYIDTTLWKLPVKKVAIDPGRVLSIGIKHGFTKTGGGGHKPNWAGFEVKDAVLGRKFLKEHVDAESYKFYTKLGKQKKVSTLVNKNIEVIGSGEFLTIITRCMTGRRPTLYKQHKEAIKKLKDYKDVQIIRIHDQIGHGMHFANQQFERVKDLVEGKYVFLLDDDDFITNPNMVRDLKECPDSDIIYFRMTILNGAYNNTYPTFNVWEKHPIMAQIGGSCFVVERELWKRNIHRFGVPRCGDFYFIDKTHRDAKKIFWLDKKMSETGRVSRGKPE